MDKKKIILIYAGITESGFNSPIGNEGTWINHGLGLISAVLKKKGLAVELIDLRRLRGWDDFKKRITEDDFGIAGLTMMSVDYNAVVTCIDIIKQMRPSVKTIVGGPHASILPKELVGNKDIDHIFVGEAEVTITDLMQRLSNGQEADRVVYGKRPNLDELPFADRDLFSLEEEPFVPFLPKPFVTIIAGRGCSYNCSYCQPAERKIFGRQVRRRSVDHVIEELRYLRKRYSFNSMMIHDDCLTEDEDWVLKFCAEYRANGFNQPFVCQSRPDLICRSSNVVSSLREAGLSLFIIGFESGSQRVLNFLRRGYDVQKNMEASEICHRLGIKIWANYMLGLPTETRQEQQMTVDMIKKIRPYHCSPAYYTPHPGSDLFDYCLEHDISLINNHDSYRRNTYEPKIKGIDYGYLKNLLWESVSIGEDQNPVFAKVKPAVPVRLKKFLRAKKWV